MGNTAIFDRQLDKEHSAGILSESTAAAYQILSVVKADRYNPHERILSIGGQGRYGSRWVISQQEAIEAIDSGKLEFFITIHGRKQRVVIAVSENGHRYLKTEVDGVQPTLLLTLPDCR